MSDTAITINRLPSISMTATALMRRQMADVQNYDTDVLPLLKLYRLYKEAFIHSLMLVPGTFYAVANFNMRDLAPESCRQRINYFDQKIARSLLGKNWSKKPDSDRPTWIAVPEQATFLHYNMIWQVPNMHQEKFYLNAPTIWRTVVPSGQFHLQVIGEAAGEADAARYYTGKTFHPRWTIDHTITSTELRRD
jgi:hypothetical protein